MELQDAIEYCLSFPHAGESTPFGLDALIYKVGGKMFALVTFRNEQGGMNLKCSPDRSLELREDWEAITPGYHMNKKHWNTLLFDGSLPSPLVKELIDHSYALVVAGLPKKVRESLQE